MFLKLIYIALIFVYLLPTKSFNLIFASELTSYLSSKNRSNNKYNLALNQSLQNIIKENFEMITGYENIPPDYEKIYQNSERGLKLLNDNKNYLIPLELEFEIKLQLAVFGSILGKYSLAESYLFEILKSAKDLYKENDTFLLDVLRSIALNYLALGNYKESKYAFETLLSIQKKYLGTNHPITISTRNELFNIYKVNGPLEKAEKMLEENKEILEKLKSNNYIEDYLFSSKRFNKPLNDYYFKHVNFALKHSYKFNKAQHNFNNGLLNILNFDYEKAEKNFIEAENIVLKIDNLRSIETNIYRYLGLINSLLTNYKKADEYYKKAILSYENHKDVSYPDYIGILTDHSSNLINMGKYQEAKEVLYKIITDNKNKKDINSFLIPVFNNLGFIYESNGSLAKAENYLLKAVKIFEKNSEFGHSAKFAYANLANVYARQRNFKKSKINLEKAFEIEIDLFGEINEKFINTIYALNLIYLNQYQDKDFLESSAWILDNIKISKNPEVFDQIKLKTLINLGDYFYNSRLFEKAESFYLDASEISDKYNTQNLDLLWRMSQIFLTRNDLKNAEKNLEKILSYYKSMEFRGYEIYPNSLLEMAKIFYRKRSDKKAENFYKKSLLISLEYLNKELPLMANDERLYLENFSKRNDIINFASTSKSAAKMSFLSIINRKGLLEEIERKQYKILKLNPKNKDFIGKIKELNSKVSLQINTQEERSRLFEEIRKIQKKIYDLELNNFKKDYFIEIEQIAKNLPNNSVLLEYKRYFPLNIETNQYDFESPKYGVFILNSSGNLDYIDLGSAKDIENKLTTTVSSINNADVSEEINQNLIKELSRSLIYPLKKIISSQETIYFSMDSFLNEVPIYALKNLDTGNYIAEEKNLRLITTPKEIIRKDNKKILLKKPLIVANPNFNSNKKQKIETLNEFNSFKLKRSKKFSSRVWDLLPSTEEEGKSIAKITNGLLITGNKATAERIQNITSPLILHIASHSYFNSEQDNEHPLIKSGVVLAGANVYKSNSIDDGLLTSLEFSKMNLEGTELVVISGCDSGKGFIKNGDNIYGLRRSITVAGAKSSILTLWPVNDSATAAFMNQFYLYLESGLDRYDALYKTQKDFRTGVIKSNDGDHWNEIYFWGAFQLSGAEGKINLN